MSQANTLEVPALVHEDRAEVTSGIANVLSRTIFISLLSLLVLTAIPYGTSQPWWIATFVTVSFALAIVWLIDGYRRGSWLAGTGPLLLPIAALGAFAFAQTISFGGSAAAIRFPLWNSISADPYQTRFFVLLLGALAICGVLLSRYAATEKRMRIVINAIICVAIASALFGIVRQTTQHSKGFGLALLIPESGYGQFINKNHFAYLMEMALGLVLGLVLLRGVKREQTLIYVAALFPLWTGLVLCNSRGGLVAMMAQVLVAILLFSGRGRRHSANDASFLRITRSLPVRITLMVVLILGVLVGTLWLGGDQLASRIEESRVQLNADASVLHDGASRNEIWRATWQMFLAHPIAGVGMAGYWAAIPAFHDASGTLTPQQAHNEYLELLASGGVIGTILVGWFAVVVIKRTRENFKSQNRFRRAACFGATVSIAGVAVHSLVDFGLHTIVNALVFTTLIAIATSKAQWQNERAPAEL
jgi:putative inorganic carbon (HCO3(-)) transporter